MVTAILVQYLSSLLSLSDSGCYVETLFGIDFSLLHFSGGAGIFHSRAFAEQVCRIFCLHRVCDRQCCSSGGRCTSRQTWCNLRSTPDHGLFGFLRLRAIPQGVGLVRGVLGRVLRGAGGGDAAAFGRAAATPVGKAVLRNARLRFNGPLRAIGGDWAGGVRRHWRMDLLQHQSIESRPQRK